MKNLIINCTILLISLVISALGGEFYLRYQGLAPKVHRLNYESSNSAFKKSDNVFLSYEMKSSYSPLEPDADYNFATNSHGQRDYERQFAQNGKNRILVLGDSVVMGLSLKDPSTLIPQTLGRILPDSYEVLNFGVTGYSPPAEVELVKVKGIKYQPKVVIWVLTDNDTDRVNKGLAFIPEHSFAYNLLLEKSSLFRLSLQLGGEYFNKFHTNGLESLKEHESTTRDLNLAHSFARMKQLADEYKFKVLVASWPVFLDSEITYGKNSLGKDGSSSIYEKYSLINRFSYLDLKKDFQIDWEKVYPRHPELTTPRTYYTYDTMHANVTGSYVAAKILSNYINLYTQ